MDLPRILQISTEQDPRSQVLELLGQCTLHDTSGLLGLKLSLLVVNFTDHIFLKQAEFSVGIEIFSFAKG
jgi:hypothetical protein